MFLTLNEAIDAIKNYINMALGPLVNTEKVALITISRDFIVQLCSTLILFLVVRFFLWKPITKLIETRRAAIDKELEDAQKAKSDAIELQKELESQLDDAKAKIKVMLDTAEHDANLKRDTIINEAKEEARKRLDNLQVELEQEKKNMEKDIKQEIVDVAFAAAEKIVAKEIDRDKYLDVVDEILKGAAN